MQKSIKFCMQVDKEIIFLQSAFLNYHWFWFQKWKYFFIIISLICIIDHLIKQYRRYKLLLLQITSLHVTIHDDLIHCKNHINLYLFEFDMLNLPYNDGNEINGNLKTVLMLKIRAQLVVVKAIICDKALLPPTCLQIFWKPHGSRS